MKSKHVRSEPCSGCHGTGIFNAGPNPHGYECAHCDGGRKVNMKSEKSNVPIESLGVRLAVTYDEHTGEPLYKVMEDEVKEERKPADDPRIVAIRNDPAVGKGTNTTIDLCYTDFDLAQDLDEYKRFTIGLAIEWARNTERLFLQSAVKRHMERLTNFEEACLRNPVEEA